MEMGFSGSLTILFLILIFVGFSTTSVADPRTIAERSTCSSTAAVSAAVLADNFVAAMNNLSSLINAQGFGTAIVGKKPNSVFTLAQCFGDLNSTDCILCFSEIRSVLPKCYPKTGGRIFFDGCFGRYENFSFFNDGKDSEDSKNCSSLVSPTTPLHRGLLGRVVGRVSSDAQKNKKGFAVGEDSAFNSTVYVLAQCWQNLHKNTCSSCLQSAASSLISCYPAVEGRAFYAGCFIRYSNKLFWNLRPRSSGKHKKLWIILGCSVFGALLLAGVGVWKINSYLHKKKLGSLRDSYGSGLCPTILNSNLSFKYQDLKKATNNFDLLNKLGQGSYGAVYKGVLPDGRTVAVKRLFINTRQWVDQFFNEVDIIHQLHHKNLVKLLGCSVDGPESLLVYEYYCNRSLDHFIFDANQVRALDWRNRLAIIQGIAEGLYYLHEESEKRIIHRDVKPSNILLDDKFKPKITDFGLARAFTQDQTHLSTGVAGTLGYMAPEYVVHGHLTEKADVYGFGILLLEIVTGQRCSTGGGTKDGESFLPKIWNEFKAKTVKSIMNENVSDDATENEFMHMVQVGLLCTQAAANYRPTMAKVVELLKRNGFEEDVFLTEPPFLDILGSEGHGSGSSYLSTGPSASQCSQDH